MRDSKENGITLMALIITIIVLLILAGVSINAIVGDNGILSQSTNAATATDISQTKEEIELALVGKYDENGKYTTQKVIDAAYEVTGNDLDVDTGIVKSAKGNAIDISDLLDGAIFSWYYTTDDDGEKAITNGTLVLTIGDYINYNPGNYTYTSSSSMNGYEDQVFNTSSYAYSWRVLGADEDTGELLLVSEDLIGPDSGGYEDNTYTRTYFYLSGQVGYANCEYELNAICSIYGNGYGANSARSIRVEDVNKITEYEPEVACFGNGEIYEYNNTVTFYWNGESTPYYICSNNATGSLTTSHSSFIYFNTHLNEWISIVASETASESNLEKITTLTNSYYGYAVTNYVNSDSTIYNLLFYNNSSLTGHFRYWLCSPYITCDLDKVNIGLNRFTNQYDERWSNRWS